MIKPSPLMVKLKDKYKEKKLLTSKLIDIFNTLENNNIILNSLTYKEKYFLNIQSKQKSNLYDFIKEFRNKCKIINIIHHKKIFTMEIEIEL